MLVDLAIGPGRRKLNPSLKPSGRKDTVSGKKMNLNSLIESIIDVGSGFLLAIAIQIFIFPFFGLYPSILDSIGIALIFTVISMLRSWVWRSYFKRRYEN